MESEVKLTENGAQATATEFARQSSALRQITFAFTRFIGFVAELCFMLALVLVAINAITEIASRQQFSAQLSSEMDGIKTELIVPSSTLERPSQPTTLTVDYEKRSSRLRSDLDDLQLLRSWTFSLAAVGARNEDQTLSALRERFGTLLFSGPINNRLVMDKPSTSDDTSQITGIMSRLWNAVGYFNNDQLLAIVVIACGAIGSIISGLRSNAHLTFRQVSLGFASGFITFLAIKGGKHVFLIQSEQGVADFNPYSSAFVGLLAGLFTERAHQLLTTCVNMFVGRIEAAIGKDFAMQAGAINEKNNHNTPEG